MPDPLTIANPKVQLCFPLNLTANGTYDIRNARIIPEDERAPNTITWQIKGMLSIPKPPGAPRTHPITPINLTTLPAGTWSHTFAVPATDQGTNATLAVELWASTDTLAPRFVAQVTTFDVMSNCTTGGGGFDERVAGGIGAAGVGKVNAPAKPRYELFSGNYDLAFVPKITRIECVIQRRHIDGRRVMSQADAELVEGRWTVVIHVPEQDPRADDYLMATFYTLGGIAVWWPEKKVQ